MLISRRSTLVSASALAAVGSISPLPVFANPLPSPKSAARQAVQHLLVHADEADGQSHCATLSLTAGDTAWLSVGNLTQSEFVAARQANRQRGFGLRRVNAFQSRAGLRYAAIWQRGHLGPSQLAHGMSAAEFRAGFAAYAAQGFALAHLDAAADGRFAAIWEKSAGAAQKVFTGLTRPELEMRRAELAGQGYRLQQIAGHAPDGEARFAAVFTNAPGVPHQVELAIVADAFAVRNRGLRQQGYLLRDASGYALHRQAFFTAIWEKA